MRLGEEMIGNSIWVNWPHMYEAKVVALETYESRVDCEERGSSKLVETASDSRSQGVFMSVLEGFTERMEKRMGLDIGPTFVLVHAQPIVGRKYMYLTDGRVTIEKEWAKTTASFALQACVKNDKMLKVCVCQRFPTALRSLMVNQNWNI